MKRTTTWIVTLLAGGLVAATREPPKTRVEVVVDRMHGVEIPDPYRWLEDQESPETRTWIKEQNAYTRSILDAVPGRERWRQQLEALYRVDSQSAPIERNGRYFFKRQSAEDEQSAIVVREGAEGEDRVLVDPAKLSPDGSVSARIMDVTPDGLVLAWAKRKGGEDEVEVILLEVDTGKEFAEGLPSGVYYDFFLLPDKSGFLYTRRRSEGTRVLERQFDTPVADDRELFGAGIPDDKLTWLQFSEDGRFVAAFVNDGAGGGARSRVYFLDRSEEGGFQPLINDIPASFSGSFGGHTLFLETTWEAPNRRMLAIDLDNPARENWREVIPESKDSVLIGVSPVGHKLVAAFLHNVSTRLAVLEPDGKLIRDVPLPTLGSGYFMGGRWDSEEAFYAFHSFSHPAATYRYNLATGKQELWFRPKTPVKSDEISTKQVWYRSKDGTRVPMFVVSKEGVKLDGNRPVLLTGYGGYGSKMTPYFDEWAAMWVNDGGIYALANIRGGGEFGEKWHRDGKLDKKQNSFDDFIAAAEWLIANKYTQPGRLAIQGGSNGGMLVAVAAMQRPDLFRAVICGAPHLDMLRYHRFLKAAPWVYEYGNPDVAEEFAYLRKYSPYHDVREGERYPAILFTTGDADTRVAPLHARKMTARMQAANRSGLPVLLRYDLVAGHSGGGGMSNYLDRQIDETAFLYSQFGLAPQPEE